MNVTDAVMTSKSIRDFLPEPIDDDVICDLLVKASRAPSQGNAQPAEHPITTLESERATVDEFATFL